MILWTKITQSRKAIFTLLILVFGSVAMWFGKLDSAHWLELTKYLMLSYIGVQGTIDGIEKMKGG